LPIPLPCDEEEGNVSSNREFSEPEVVQAAEARGPQGPLEPLGQLVGGLGGGIGIRKGFLTDELSFRGHEGMFDDEMDLGHAMGGHHLDGPSGGPGRKAL